MTTIGASTALTAAECDQLVATVRCGHLAVTRGALPVIVPVRIDAVDGQSIRCTSADPDVAGTDIGAVVALQVGGFDSEGAGGWSVLVQGTIAAPDPTLTPSNGHRGGSNRPWPVVIRSTITSGHRFRWDSQAPVVQ